MAYEVNSLKITYDALGVLLEAAIRDQESIEKAVESMNALITALNQQRMSMPATIVASVKSELSASIEAAAQTLTTRVASTNLAADQAAQAFQRAAKFSLLRVCAPALFLSLVAIAIWFALAALSVHSLENEKAELEQRIAYLDSRGGHLDVSTCPSRNGESVPCIRVDETQKFQNGYRIPFRVK